MADLDEKGLEAAIEIGVSQGIRDERRGAERITDAIRAYLDATQAQAPNVVEASHAIKASGSIPRVNGRDIYEVANQLDGYVDEGTPERLAQFLIREGKAASDLADEIVRLHAALSGAEAKPVAWLGRDGPDDVWTFLRKPPGVGAWAETIPLYSVPFPAATERGVVTDWPKELVSIPDPNEKDARIVGFRIREGDEAWGKIGLSEPLFWLEKRCRAALSAPSTPDGWRPITCKDDKMTCPLPADETTVEVMLQDGTVCHAWFSCNIMEAGDWDFLPVDERDEPDDAADSIADKIVAWRPTPPTGGSSDA